MNLVPDPDDRRSEPVETVVVAIAAAIPGAHTLNRIVRPVH